MKTSDLEQYVKRHAPPALEIELQAAMRNLFRVVDALAIRSADLNASWHNDESQPDHSEYHAPAEIQYPLDVRREFITNQINAFTP